MLLRFSTTHTLSFILLVLGLIAVLLGLMPLQIWVINIVFFGLLLSYKLQNREGFKAILWIAVLITGLIIGLYRPQGFNYPLLFSIEALHTAGKPFDLYINTGKLLAGYLALVVLIQYIKDKNAFMYNTQHQVLLIVFLNGVVVGVATILLQLKWHPKPEFIWLTLIFLTSNLLVTVVTEEVFMRLIVQRQITQWLNNIEKLNGKALYIEGIAVTTTSLIFLITHSTQSVATSITFFIAGFAYAFAYSLTKNITAPIATHFGVNLLHFCFLTYPL